MLSQFFRSPCQSLQVSLPVISGKTSLNTIEVLQSLYYRIDWIVFLKIDNFVDRPVSVNSFTLVDYLVAKVFKLFLLLTPLKPLFEKILIKLF